MFQINPNKLCVEFYIYSGSTIWKYDNTQYQIHRNPSDEQLEQQ